MNKPKRNWLLTLACVPPLVLFLYIGIGVWLLRPEEPVYAENYLRLTISGLCLLGVFVLARVIRRGYTKKSAADIITDFLASI